MSATALSPSLGRSTAHDERQQSGWLSGIRAKLYASLAPTLLLMVAVGGFAVYSLGHVSTLSTSMYRNGLAPVETLGQIRADAGLLNIPVIEALADSARAS